MALDRKVTKEEIWEHLDIYFDNTKEEIAKMDKTITCMVDSHNKFVDMTDEERHEYLKNNYTQITLEYYRELPYTLDIDYHIIGQDERMTNNIDDIKSGDIVLILEVEKVNNIITLTPLPCCIY